LEGTQQPKKLFNNSFGWAFKGKRGKMAFKCHEMIRLQGHRKRR